MTVIPEGYSGFLMVVKKDCNTCRLIETAIAELQNSCALRVISQDDPYFPAGVRDMIDDRELEWSYRLQIEMVPTLIECHDGVEQARLVGWLRDEWRSLTGLSTLGDGLPQFSPGCGSRTVETGMPESLAYKYGDTVLQARRIEVAELEDVHDLMFERGWSDGLPVVPPTKERVIRMLTGTRRAPDEIVGVIPPDQAPCTVEKIAINAVMAGCKPEIPSGGAGGRRSGLPRRILYARSAGDDLFLRTHHYCKRADH